MWFNINIQVLLVETLIIALRKADVVAWIRPFVTPLQSLYDQWFAYRRSNLIKLSYNSQVCYLRKGLNDSFDPELRRILITDAPALDQDFIYTRQENSPVYLGTMFLEQNFMYTGSGVDFFVKVPAELLQTSIEAINAFVDYYRLCGKTFKIIEL